MLTVANAPRARLDTSVEFAAQLAEHVFPLSEAGVTIHLDPDAAVLRPPRFAVGKDLEDPDTSFDHVDQTKRARIIFDGLTRFGAYDKPTTKIRLAVFTTPDRRVPMEQLVRRLNDGKFQYSGARKTFGSEFVVRDVRICSGINDYEDEIRQFVRTSARGETDVALLYLPEEGNTNDSRHPYFRTKALLLKEGLASQMVDRNTAANLDWKDLNLALNIYAKAGNTPWVLDKPMPGADMFIGLSYSSRGTRVKRMMSYVNVFDSYGRWRFYDGDTEVFLFDDRLKHYRNVVGNAVATYRAENGGQLQSVHIHLTKKFSAEERAVIAQAVRAEAPGASVVFVSINAHHIVRMYDLTEGGDGSIRRATYLRDDPGRLYLATTGSNDLNQKGMGTPIPLELTVWTEPKGVLTDTNVIAQHILSLTRLNWASVKSFCREPITTKFAGAIANKMTAFMADPQFFVNTSLRGTPWFL
jgi:argonaute-like protein implicated in RNA metabolism and viral defense